MKKRKKTSESKRDKKIERLVKLNYTTNTEAIKNIFKVKFYISLAITLFCFTISNKTYSGLLDLSCTVIYTLLIVYVITILISIFIFPTFILTGSVRGGVSRGSMQRFIACNPYGEYCIDFITYLLKNNRITKEEYDRYIENNPSLKYMLNEMNYKPKPVWFESVK